MTGLPILPRLFKISNMKNWFILCLLLIGNCLLAQVIPFGFLKTNRAPFVAPAIVSNGLILNLDAANPSSYSGSGSTWSNLITGNSVANFTLISATYTSDNGGAIRFSSSGYASTTNTFGRISSYTIEIWVKMANTTGPSPTSNYTPCLFSEVYSNASVNMVLAYNWYNAISPTSYQYLAGFYNNGWNTTSTTTNTNDFNNWIHIVATYGGNILNIYKNGAKIASATIVATNTSTSNGGYYIGHRWDSADLVYGDYSMVNLYNRALSSSEITTNYNAFKLRFGL